MSIRKGGGPGAGCVWWFVGVMVVAALAAYATGDAALLDDIFGLLF
jgi:hypothetical protein